MWEQGILKSAWKKILVYFLLAVITIGPLFPIFWMISSSFKVRRDWTALSFIPSVFTTENYSKVISSNLFPALPNSLIIAFSSTVIAVFLSLMGAYVLSRFNFKWKSQIENYIISTRFIPPVIFLLPLFISVTRLKLMDTHFIMILFYAMMNIPYTLWIMKSFIDEIPAEIDEAALIDGCSRWQILLRIIIPISIAGIVVVFMFAFIFAWNEFLIAFAFTRSNAVTLSLQIMGLARSNVGLQLGPISALVTIATIPVLIIVAFLQRYIVRGLTFGAIK